FAASILVGCSDVASGCDCACKPCGPGGEPCANCEGREKLCQNLVWQVRELKKKIQQCVCGVPTWMM
ncbi:hypothetical protein KR026_002765, partial [Drosophila bipectinata]